MTDKDHDPTLTLIYLPHLDYNIQRYGVDFQRIAKDLKEVDAVVGQLVAHYDTSETNVIILSEYGITNVSRPVHLNRVLRKAGHLAIRVERGLELLDAGASSAFAVADHQLAHVYVKDKGDLPKIKALLEQQEGVEQVYAGEDIKKVHLDHGRSGDLVVVADKESWFTYYFWLDDAKAPDYARMVDIHKKPGYDPVEMLTDPKDKWVMAKVAWKLLKKKMGFRTVLDIIPLKAELIKGSHGRVPEEEEDFPIIMSNKASLSKKTVSAVDVYGIITQQVLS